MKISHKIIDSHCHLQFPQFDEDRVAVIRRSLDAGVGMICVGTDLAMSQKAISLAEQYEGIWASVGIHPNDIGTEAISWKEFQTLLKHPKVAAIGEVGLDYYRTSELEKQKLQKDALQKFFDLSIEVDKPLIIHCRDAHADMLTMIRGRGVVHSFTGTINQANAYIKKEFFIGLNGIITFSREYDTMVRDLPVDRIVVETDSPYLTPVPHRGKRNEPIFVEKIIDHISIVKNMNVYELRNIILNNTQSIFHIEK